MNTKYLFTVGATLLCTLSSIFAQSLTIEEAQEKATKHHPAIVRYDVIEMSKKMDVSNANKAYLPHFSIGAQATWQSDVNKLPLEIPNIDIPVPEKDQYKAFADINQLIWDGGQVEAQKKAIVANAEVEKQKVQTEVYALRERVNQLFFGILLLNEQLELQNSMDEELQRNLENVETYIKNGVANEADLSAVKIEQLKARQSRIQKESSRMAYIKMLSVLMGENISLTTQFVKPVYPEYKENSLINRPEMRLFDAQQELIASQKRTLIAKNLPTIGAFAQSGYGKPALNIFENKFNPYFVGGVRLSWNFGNLYTLGNEKRKIDMQQTILNSQRETFLYNLNTQIPQQQIEIEKFKQTMQQDDEIIRLRTLIRESAQAKVANGTMTVSDMLREVTEEDAAKQAKSLHEIQYLMSLFTLKNTTN